MKKDMKMFTNENFGNVRVIQDNDKVLFVGSDVAKALGYSNPRDALARHCRCVVKRDVPHPQNNSTTQEVSVITEGDMYRLIAHSKLPEAQKFESWVFDEVLPSIRKSGTYSLVPDSYTIEDPIERAKAWIGEQEKHRAEIAVLAPKAAFFDDVADSKSAISMSEVAKVLAIPGVGRNKLFGLLREYKVLMGDNRPYQRYIDNGWFRMVEQKYSKENGDTVVTTKTLVFQKGVDGIRKVIGKGNI